MSGCESQTFQNFTQDRFDRLAQKAAGSGIAIGGNQGQASQDGVTLRWTFDPANSTLDIECVDAPFFVRCGMINGKIRDLVDSCP
jgi:hypothetical protein